MSEPKLEIWCDGACKGNPGPGGWGVYLKYGSHTKSICGGAKHTTNNQMELQAAIESLKALKLATELTIYTDSKYVVDGITKWVPSWQAKGWKTAAGTPVKNLQQWKDLHFYSLAHKIKWQWVKGHGDNPGNTMADSLANKGAEPFL